MKNTLHHLLFDWSKNSPNAVAQRVKRDGSWKLISTQKMMDQIFSITASLKAEGLIQSSQDVGAILSYNTPEWVQMEMAIQLAGGMSAGLYPNSSEKEIRYILEHTEAKILFVQNRSYLEKLLGKNLDQPMPESIEKIILWDAKNVEGVEKVESFQSFLEKGEALKKNIEEKELHSWIQDLDPKKEKFLIYTSGTTGNPKGSMLSHENIIFTAKLIHKFLNLKQHGEIFSFLPLCHIAEKIHNYGVGLCGKYTTSYASKFEAVITEIVEVQPTVLLSVPRLWDKMREGVMKKAKKLPEKRRMLFSWALRTGSEYTAAKIQNKKISRSLETQYFLAERMVLKKIRHALGLSRAEICVSGAAALSSQTAEWFRSLGIELLEEYGQTESTGVICFNEPGKDHIGTVGRVVDGIEMQLSPEGEILTRGKHVFLGYFKDEKATKDTIDEEGWLHTGDLGVVTKDGLIKIQGRIKEIVKTSGGKMIAPLPLEDSLKKISGISQTCIVGDGRDYLSVLLTLDEDTLGEIHSKQNSTESGRVVDPYFQKKVRDAIDQINSKLAPYEQIKKFMILDRDFSIEEGEMTPTMKIKRYQIEKKWKPMIDQMYS